MKYLEFRIDPVRIAVALANVQKVVRVPAILPLPNAPGSVEGFVNYHGHVLPVFDVRTRVGAQQQAIDPSEHLVIADTESGRVAFRVDEVLQILSVNDDAVTPVAHPALENLRLGDVLALSEGIVLIQNLNMFLSIQEVEELRSALQNL